MGPLAGRIRLRTAEDDDDRQSPAARGSFASVTEARAQTTTTRCLTGSDRLCLRWRFSRRPRARPCRRPRQAFRADSLLPLSAELPESQSQPVR